MKIKRVFLLVLDSFGIGQEPDAAAYGDGVCSTLGSVRQSAHFSVPNLRRLGLFNIDGVPGGKDIEAAPAGAFGRLQECSKGKDTTIGHWEIAGIVSEHPLPTYPQGFPPDVIESLERAWGRKALCNKPYSGTQVIHDYGREHMATGSLIVYTSADSVLQIAAHEDIVPPEELYGYCRQARAILTGRHSVGRVIARPFIGTYPDYERTPRRHDFSMQPPAVSMLDVLTREGLKVIGIGKISDIFAARGISEHISIEDNADGMAKTLACQQRDFTGLCFVNLVDFDMKYGHRRDIDGYAQALTDFDGQLATFLAHMEPEDLLMITADHGCDPGAPGTDHTREYVPYLVYGTSVQAGVDLGTSPTFADIAATVLDVFHLPQETRGTSLMDKLLR